MTPDLLIPAFVTLFVVIDPIGLAPLFVALTKGAGAAHRRAIALRAVAIAALLLTVFGLFGEQVLQFLGISMPAFRIAGGLLLFLTALDMLFERRAQRRRDQSETGLDPAEDPSVFPLATPLIGGPGAMAAMILLAGKTTTPAELVAIHLVMLAVLVVVFVLFLASGLLERALKETGINVLTRLLGMLLAALAVQFVLDGLADFGFLG
ncbi:MarC family protein [Maritimibacter sp. HL-12]|jgi:multiple antibiotic resistance protein|uniref:MarC family protein n=1 Tax=Maritimibacter sp. HL-12 TaxID=1162418 RepID=UPI000A0F1801|nr:MarC family protein [Maritimibacter sp. HL-12]SMH30912.1 multiple antibiotic resistance protein [Maritimibacter sp. HL-12]